MAPFRSIGHFGSLCMILSLLVGSTHAPVSAGVFNSAVVSIGQGKVDIEILRSIEPQERSGADDFMKDVVAGDFLSGVTAIAAGGAHSCALVNGEVMCWGLNVDGRLGDGTTTSRWTPVGVPGTAGATAIAAGGHHTCAVVNGTVKCWGWNYKGQLGDGTTRERWIPGPVQGVNGATAVAAGDFHTCALVNGGVKCWGDNSRGQLGDGTYSDSWTPTDVLGVSGASAIVAGSQHTCALTNTGVKCWGYNELGQLGDGTSMDRPTPVNVPPVIGATAIAAGALHTCALVNASVKCWGNNGSGQLGDGTVTDSRIPVDVQGVNGATELVAGHFHTCALVNGGVKCWGNNSAGELGDGTTTSHWVPAAVQGVIGATAISAGWAHTCVLVGGGAKCWGWNLYGQLGVNPGRTPVDVQGMHGVTAISAGLGHTCVLVNGVPKCWGLNDYGQLGDGTTVSRWQPIDVVGVVGATAIASGERHTCAIVSGLVKCWGSNYGGQLGDGTTTDRWTPVDVPGVRGASVIAAGDHHTCAVVNDGVKCWGSSDAGELGDGAWIDSYVPVDVLDASGTTGIALGGYHTCAVLNASIRCWGGNGHGELGDGTTTNRLAPIDVLGTSGAVAVAAGSFHSCAVANGSIKCWGDNAFGQLGDGTTTDRWTPTEVQIPTGATSLAAGPSHTCAIVNGEVKCWGWNLSSQLGDGTWDDHWAPVTVPEVSGANAITAGGAHTCVLMSSGIKCWGANGVGQLGINPGWTPQDVVAGKPAAPIAPLEPVVFIPGIGGSRLRGANDPLDLWPQLLAPNDTVKAVLVALNPFASPVIQAVLAAMDAQARRLTRDVSSSDYDPNIYATDAIRKALGFQDIYDSFIGYLVSDGGYRPYVLPSDVDKLPGYGCDTSQTQAIPNIFIFPYDWRRSNAENAVLLKNYINSCVRFYFPNHEVNLVTHSMGGLLARRYILDNPSNHHVKKMITLAAPWLGAPKMLDGLETGSFTPAVNAVMIKPDRLKELVRTFPSAHELLPSPRYFGLGNRPLAEAGYDLDGDRTRVEGYDFENFRYLVTDRYGPAVAQNGFAFHSLAGQDDWSADTSGVEYHHLYGAQTKNDTLVRIDVVPFEICVSQPLLTRLCHTIPVWRPNKGVGDGTVPAASALRSSATATGDGSVSSFHRISPAGVSADSFAEHGGMMLSPLVQKCVVDLLAGRTCPSVLRPSSDGTVYVGAAADAEVAVESSTYQVTAIGVSDGAVVDSEGNASGILYGAILVDRIPDVSYDMLGNDAFSVVAPVSGAYTVTFRSGDTPLLLQVTKGTSDLTEQAIRYVDLVVPADVILSLTLPLDATGSSALRYDSDNDGVADSDVAPTVSLSGSAAQDTDAPTIRGTVTDLAGGKRVEFTATDNGSGVSSLFYSLDGTTFSPYTASIEVQKDQAAVYAFADDNATNRSPLFTLSLENSLKLFLPSIRR